MSRKSVLVGLMVAFAVAGLSACSNSGGGPAARNSTTLRMAFSYDPGSLDPDEFYDGEGANITMSTYEGLVRYKGNSSIDIEPLLAKSYKVSKDGLTYTFNLRDGVKFHDGTSMNSASWKTDIERRQKLKRGSAYMVDGIASIGTPNPQTLVIELDHPVSAFLNHLASPYGPKAVSPDAIKKHESKGDLATKWMANHSAGTGPYQLGSVTPGQSYELKAFPGYWGNSPRYKAVRIGLVPSFTTQELMLERGELDFVYHGIPKSDLMKLERKGFEVQKFDSIVRLNLWINPNVEPFTNPKIRNAIAKAIDRKTIIEQVYGDTADVAKQMFPPKALPESMATFQPENSSGELTKLAAGQAKVDLAYTTDDSLNAQVAQLVQTQLSAAGLKVTTRGVTQQTTFGWPTQAKGRASMLILPANPDDADASSWSTLFYAKNGGLSYFTPQNVSEADALIQKGLGSVDPKDIASYYAQAADAYRASGDYVPLADLKQVTISQPGICGWQHDFSTLWAMRLQDLTTKC